MAAGRLHNWYKGATGLQPGVAAAGILELYCNSRSHHTGLVSGNQMQMILQDKNAAGSSGKQWANNGNWSCCLAELSAAFYDQQ